MSTLFGNNISQTYQGLIKLADSTTGVTATTQSLQDGLGNNIPIQVSNDTVNISGSFLVNGQPVSIETGSFATTGSNTFIGDQTITGSLYQSGTFYPDVIDWVNSSILQNTGSYILTVNTQGVTEYDTYQNVAAELQPYINTGSFNRDGLITTGSAAQTQSITGSLNVSGDITANSASFNYLTTIYETASIIYSSGSNQLGDASDDTQTLWGTIKIPTGPVGITGSLYVSSSVQKDVIVDGQIWVSSSLTTATTATTQPQVNVAGYRNATRRGTSQLSPGAITLYQSSSVSGEGTAIIGATGLSATNNNGFSNQFYAAGLGSSNTMNYAEYKGIYNNDGTIDVEQELEITSSGSLFRDWNNGVFDYSTYMSLAPNNGNNPAPQFTRGLGITGSLNVNGNTTISGSLIGGTLNNGLIKIQSQENTSSSLATPFGYISSSNPNLQTNIIFGTNTSATGSGLLPNNLTGSIVISGSNNILFSSNRANTLVSAGTYGYINGANNTVINIPLLGTGSLVRPNINGNTINGGLTLQFTTSSVAIPNINNNLIYGATNINHQSSSINFTGNYIGAQSFTSNANTTTADILPSVLGNIIQGIDFPIITLNHNSSSINYQGNIGGGLTVTNNYTSSINQTTNNIFVRGNLLNGSANTLVVTGSNTATRRTFDYNFINGRSNIINSNHSGSNTGHLVATSILGQNLIVSASNITTVSGGSTFVGRFNATGSLQESSQDAVFVVGTGTNDATRRNAIHIDSNNNTRITGSVSISGSLTVNGVTVSSDRNGLITTGSASPNTQTISGSLLVTGGITGSIDKTGLITTGSVGLTQQLTGSLRMSSGSLLLDDGTNSAKIADYYNRNVIFKSEDLGKILVGGNCNMDQIDTQFGVVSGSINLNVFGGSTLNFRTGSNNTWFTSSPGLRSGSNNTFIGTSPSFTTGSGNFIIGTFDNTRFSGTEVNSVFSIGTSTANSFLFKSGSGPTTIVGATTISGSLISTADLQGQNIRGIGISNFQDNVNITGTTYVSGSVNVTGQYLVNGVPFSGGTSGTSGTNGSSGTSGVAGSSGTSGTSFETPYTGNIVVTGSIDITGQYLVNGTPITGSGGGDRNGLITTGSIAEIQSITGSLLLNSYNSTIISNTQTIPSGSGNVIIGSGSVLPDNLTNNIVIGAGGNSVFTYNGGSDRITLQKGTTLVNGLNVTGSVILSGSVNITGSLKATSAVSASLGLHAAGGSTSTTDYLNVGSNLQGNYIYGNNFLSNTTLFLTPAGTANVVVQGSGAGGLRIASGFGIYNTGSYSQSGSLFNVNSPTINLTGSVAIQNVLTLEPITPLPSGKPTGSLAVSGSSLYFYNGTWTLIV